MTKSELQAWRRNVEAERAREEISPAKPKPELVVPRGLTTSSAIQALIAEEAAEADIERAVDEMLESGGYRTVAAIDPGFSDPQLSVYTQTAGGHVHLSHWSGDKKAHGGQDHGDPWATLAALGNQMMTQEEVEARMAAVGAPLTQEQLRRAMEEARAERPKPDDCETNGHEAGPGQIYRNGEWTARCKRCQVRMRVNPSEDALAAHASSVLQQAMAHKRMADLGKLVELRNRLRSEIDRLSALDEAVDAGIGVLSRLMAPEEDG